MRISIAGVVIWRTPTVNLRRNKKECRPKYEKINDPNDYLRTFWFCFLRQFFYAANMLIRRREGIWLGLGFQSFKPIRQFTVLAVQNKCSVLHFPFSASSSGCRRNRFPSSPGGNLKLPPSRNAPHPLCFQCMFSFLSKRNLRVFCTCLQNGTRLF